MNNFTLFYSLSLSVWSAVYPFWFYYSFCSDVLYGYLLAWSQILVLNKMLLYVKKVYPWIRSKYEDIDSGQYRTIIQAFFYIYFLIKSFSEFRYILFLMCFLLIWYYSIDDYIYFLSFLLLFFYGFSFYGHMLFKWIFFFLYKIKFAFFFTHVCHC
jgi:hypothetical protein